MNKREDYLDAAVAGLRGDPELQRDRREELAAHLDDADADGRDGLARLGPVTDLAADMLAGNRRLLRGRARLRLVLQALLIPAAVVVAVWASGVGQWVTAKPADRVSLAALSGGPGNGLMDMLSGGPAGEPSAEARRLLYANHPDRVGRAHDLWADRPDDLVLLNNWVNEATSRVGDLPAGDYEDILRLAMATDPNNARYWYLLAAHDLDAAAEVIVKRDEPDRLEVHDQERLDAAMQLLREGLTKPHYRRYHVEMLQRRLAALGVPRNRADQIRQITVGAGVLLPGLSKMRNLARACILYGRQRAEQAGLEAAKPYLGAPVHIGMQLNDDAFCLIDVLVAKALIDTGGQGAAVWDDFGRPDIAAQVKARAMRLATPVDAWREQVKNHRADDRQAELLKARGSAMAAMLLPALGQDLDLEDFRADRLLEYLQLDRALAVLISAALLLAMLGAGLVALRWRFSRGGGAIAILLMPDRWWFARTIGLGVLLPLAAYTLVTRLPVLGGRDYSITYTGGRIALQTALLLAAMVGTIAWTATEAAARRCRELGIEPAGHLTFAQIVLLTVVLLGAAMVPVGARQTEPGGNGTLLAVLWVVAAIVAAVCLTVVGRMLHRRASDPRPARRWPRLAALGVGVALALVPFGGTAQHPELHLGYAALAALILVLLLGKGLVAAAHGLFTKQGLFAGTVARSMLPLLAGALIVHAAITRPLLDWRERQLVAADKLLQVPTDGGFTRIEAELTQRLRDATRRAAEAEERP